MVPAHAQLQQAVQSFVAGIEEVVNLEVQRRLSSVAQRLNIPAPRGPGRPKKFNVDPFAGVFPYAPGEEMALKPRKPHPVQLCPVLGCKNKAAPSLGMICLDHKDVDPKTIARYRLGRRWAKENNLSFEEVMKNWNKYRKRIKRHHAV